MEIGRDEQGQPDYSERPAPFLVLSALRDGAVLVEGVDKGEKVGIVKEHASKIDIEFLHHVRCDFLLDLRDSFIRHTVHVVPEALACELSGFDVQ